MLHPYNTYLRGFLGLLDAKVGGEGPRDFETAVRPTLDVYPFLYSQRRIVTLDVTAAFGNNATGYQAFPLLVVPNDQIWLVWNFSIDVGPNLLAAELLSFVPAYRTRAGGIATVVTLAQPGPTATVNYKPCSTASREFILGPGDDCGGYNVLVTSAAAILVLQGRITYTSCQI